MFGIEWGLFLDWRI